ncbi:MAG: insulinase family protein [Burkholderiales bacterium]|nr:insulinase family protein [Burkholderiales bacterium]
MHRAIRVVALVGALSATVAHATLPIEEWHLPNGARVLFVENRALPMVDVSVDFPAGYGREPAGRSGVASMTLSMLRLGAGGLAESDIAARLADTGGQMSTRFDADRGGYQLRTLSSLPERDVTVDLLARVIERPAFPADVLDREKSRLLAGIREADTKPESIAERAFAKALYGNHPYGRRSSGELDTVATLGVDDLRRFYATHYRSDYAVVAIIGDLSRAEADAMAHQLTDDLPRAEAPLPPLPPVPPLAVAQERHVAHPASQSHILVGQPGMQRRDPDYFALFVGNYMLGGGGFSSRLVDEVRQKRGLAYSSYSYFVTYERQGPFQMSLQTKKNQAGEALAVVRETLRRYVEEGPSQQELDAAKQNLIGGFPLRIDSNRKIHDYLGIIGFYDLPLDYLDRFVDNVQAVTLEQVREAFHRRIQLDRMVTVVVGPEPEPLTQ